MDVKAWLGNLAAGQHGDRLVDFPALEAQRPPKQWLKRLLSLTAYAMFIGGTVIILAQPDLNSAYVLAVGGIFLLVCLNVQRGYIRLGLAAFLDSGEKSPENHWADDVKKKKPKMESQSVYLSDDGELLSVSSDTVEALAKSKRER
jgi:hypothetical protein